MNDESYVPLNIHAVPECELFMLPGVKATRTAFTIGPIRITRLSFGDWMMIEKSQFVDDLQDVYAYGRQPYFCVFASMHSNVAEPLVTFRTSERQAIVKRLTFAMRLAREEPLYDPTCFISYRHSDSLNIRNPNTYGRRAYNIPQEILLDANDIEHLERLYWALETFDCFRQSAPIRLAVELFNNSYDLSAMEAGERLLLLLGALEALTDGRDKPLRSIRWPESRFKRFLDDFRQKRNEIAHGGTAGGPADLADLRHIVRCLICEGMAVELMDPDRDHSSGLALLDGMRDQTVFGSARLAGAHVAYDAWHFPGRQATGPQEGQGNPPGPGTAS